MKTTTSKSAIFGLALAGLIGSAHAIPVSLTEPITSFSSSSGSNNFTNSPITFTFNLTNFGYDGSLHTIDSALLALTFNVSGPGPQQSQDITLGFADQGPIIGSAAALQNMAPFALNPADFDLASGVLAFSLQRTNSAGSFSLASASLNLNASLLQVANPDSGQQADNPTPIPEPSTLALLGLGLLGSILFARRPRQAPVAHSI